MWKTARVLEEVTDNTIVLFKKNELITIKEGENRQGFPAYEVVNHPFRNGFIFAKGTIEILGDAYAN